MSLSLCHNISYHFVIFIEFGRIFHLNECGDLSDQIIMKSTLADERIRDERNILRFSICSFWVQTAEPHVRRSAENEHFLILCESCHAVDFEKSLLPKVSSRSTAHPHYRSRVQSINKSIASGRHLANVNPTTSHATTFNVLKLKAHRLPCSTHSNFRQARVNRMPKPDSKKSHCGTNRWSSAVILAMQQSEASFCNANGLPRKTTESLRHKWL